MLLTAGTVLAAPILINDDPAVGPYTQSEQWVSGQEVGGTYSGSGNFSGDGHSDAIGDEFATRRIEITANTITIWTNNQPGGWTEFGRNWGIADIALNTNSSTAAYSQSTMSHFGNIQSPYETGIIMQDYLTGTSGTAVAKLVGVSAWTTSWDEVNPYKDPANPGTNFLYGGAYKGSQQTPTAARQPVETKILDYTNVLAEGTMSWAPDGSAGPGGYPEYIITVTFPTISDLTAQEILWGTSLCGNDPVYAHAPLPATVLLLGSGLLGLVALRYRKRARSKAALFQK